MGLLVTFLFRNMKGLRGLVVLAMIITVLQVSCDIFAAFPLKFIPSKVQNPGNDPECLVPFLGPIESWFDIPQIDPSLQRDPRFAASTVPPAVQCPVNLNDPQIGTALQADQQVTAVQRAAEQNQARVRNELTGSLRQQIESLLTPTQAAAREPAPAR